MTKNKKSSTKAESAGAMKDNSWPGKNTTPTPKTTHPNHWNPAGYGPGMGPELISDSQKPVVENSSTNAEPVWESCTISEAADNLVRFRLGDECPNCGFAKLALDANNHVSCPICGFGAYRACG